MPAKSKRVTTKIKKNHVHPVPKGLAKQALKAAKELEKIPMPSQEEIVRVYKDAFEQAKRLQKLLKPAWFVQDTDKPGKKRKKRVLRPSAK
jgi:hypothetical protein